MHFDFTCLTYIQAHSIPKEQIVNTAKTTKLGPRRLKTVTHSYAVDRLHIRHFEANVRIGVHEGPGIQVSITGTRRQIDKIDAKVEYNSLALSTKWKGSLQHNMHLNGKFSALFTTNFGELLTVFLERNNRVAQVEILVPEGGYVWILDLLGNLEVGDTLGDIMLYLQSPHTATVGKVRSARLHLSKQASVSIMSTSKHLDAHLESGAQLNVLDSEGRGAVNIEATDHSLAYIARCNIQGNLRIVANSSAQVHIDEAQARQTVLRAITTGHICANGRLGRKDFKSHSRGTILVNGFFAENT